MAAPELAGRTLAGRYDVLELLGAGGMGSVYRARDRELDELVALKVIRSDRATPHTVEQFRHEVKLARRVTHVNVARTFELGVADGVMFCTMELVEGESLRRRLRREGPIAPAEATAIARALCDGLAVAHAAGVIHRDIKPDNVLLASDGRVVLADFGVAAITAGDTGGGMAGTLEYMAPEQARGEPPTPASDVYSVGLVLYEMLTGLRAFAGTVSKLIVAKQDLERVTFEYAEVLSPARVPAELADIVGRATAREPEDRIGSARELGRLLEPWVVAEPVAKATAAQVSPAIATVVVLAPRGDDERLHIAAGVHQELLRRLARRPGIRVWPRVEAVDVDNGTIVELRAGATLEAKIRNTNTSVTLQLPLEIAHIPLAADTIAQAVCDAVAYDPAEDPGRLELVLRARALAHRGFGGVRPAYELLLRARTLYPDDPRIASELASLLARFVFVGDDIEAEFNSVPELVAYALALAPEIAEAHVAKANLELNLGSPELAAIEFRTAIACSPYLAEPHEGLGRMLLEAGFLDDAMARLDDALAIAPDLSSVRWDIARAHALEQNWLVCDEMVDELRKAGDRQIARMRFALWRGDIAAIRGLRESLPRNNRAFEPELIERNLDSLVAGTWAQHRDRLAAIVRTGGSPSKRRRAFIAQMVAETAGHFGDTATCLAMLDYAVGVSLYDLHWFDRCPMLAAARATREGARLRAIVEQRAHAIQDALYCDLSAKTEVR